MLRVALIGVGALVCWAIVHYCRPPQWEPDNTHRKASKAWRGVDYEGL